MNEKDMMDKDSGFDSKDFISTPYLKLLEDREGATCLCYQMRLHGKLHFVKKIRPEFENDARMRAAFRKENEIGFSLSHPNIPRYVFMEGIFSPEEYVVTEWFDGLTLDKFIENHPEYFCDRENFDRLIHQLAEALDYLHQNGITHRDLKPSNIMLSRDGERAKLLDLGYSISDAHTLTGGFTHDFASPGMITEEEAGEAVDYYSLGKIIEFIENHTECRLPKVITGLKAALTFPEIKGRIRRKEEIYKILEKKRSRWIWLAVLPLVGLFLGVLIAKINKDSSYPTGPDIDRHPIVKEEIENASPSPQGIEESEPEEPNYSKEDNRIAEEKTEKPKVDIETEKENIKEEVNGLLKLNYAPVINRLDSLTQANVFTRDWYFKITNESGEAMRKSIEDSYYYEKYPSIPKDEVIYILSTEYNDFNNKIWQPKLDGYRKNIPH